MKTLIQLLIGIAVCLGAAYLLRIDPQTDYGCFMGGVHGLLLVPNWLLSIFNHEWMIKAQLHTSAYNIAWWVCGIIDIAYWAWAIIGAIISMAKR